MRLPKTLREWLFWYIVPRFPKEVLSIVDKSGKVWEYADEEIEVIAKGKSMSIVRLRGEKSIKTVAVAAGDPLSYATLYTPWQLFGHLAMRWITFVYTIFYYAIFTPLILFPEIFANPAMIALATALVVYIISTYFRFKQPSILYIILHEYGEWGGLPLYVPGPHPQSRLGFIEIMKYAGYVQSPRYRDEAIEELNKKVEVLYDENLRLHGVIYELSQRMGQLYEKAVADVALTAPSEVIEKIRANVLREVQAKIKFYWIIILVGIPLAFAMGYLLAGGGVAISAAP